MRLLLIEDYRPLSNALTEALTRSSFAVDQAFSLQEAQQMAKAADYDLIILDLGLPDGDGLTLLPSLRASGKVPVIVMTARDQLNDRLAGLDGGADDYIVKPIEMPELIARCRAVLRRPGERSDTTLKFGNVCLDTISRAVTINDQAINLGKREIGVLEMLLVGAGRVIPRHSLEEAVYTFDDAITPNALEASISRLRKALRIHKANVSIVTLRGVGWMITEEDSQ